MRCTTAHPGVDADLTERSGGGWSPHWDRALKQFVGQLMIGATRAWGRGVILWNLALNGNTVRTPVAARIAAAS